MDGLDDLGAKNNFEHTIAGRGTQTNGLVIKSAANFPGAIAVADVARAIHPPHFHGLVIFQLRQLAGIRSLTQSIAAGGGGHLQCFMRTLAVVNTTPVIKTFLHLDAIAPAAALNHLGFERAMNTFFWSLLAQAVRMSKRELTQSIGAATDLIYHALFVDTR